MMKEVIPQTLIALDNLSKTFGGNRALSDISLSLLAGEVHCLAGTNGCGKSTLIKVTEICKIPITIGKNHSEIVTCDVVDMEAVTCC